MSNTRQKFFNVRFGGELLWMGAAIEPEVFDPAAVLEALIEQANGVRKATHFFDNRGDLYFDLLVYAPEFCVDWDARKDELKAQAETFDPLLEVIGDLQEGTLDALSYIVEKHLPEDWQWSHFSDVRVALPKKG